ncbi:diguanylate cyclase [Halomonas sp. MCCC 1A17488]|uniref:GGDEF domain-containing protein n=1 Tax=unclassified Halomonas TaxID=2609666 RepID=UPI0018D1F702|nr:MULTISPECIES: GGDEF domain-containing protein [unclassified Halomonas]MCE8014755.1 diguanylate cyclase [Halomonas sp. MCCC 1A17488]MCG3238088.1 diguanylate cyclase [Halomonas sp. MCCC 1A17488]QPP48138.1 diguanylate cyclase [Halomonas sp. SS10-MC5]
MSEENAMTGGELNEPTSMRDFTERLPGVVFQFHRDHHGHMHFPYLAGSGTGLPGIDRNALNQDARHMLDRLDEEDYPRVMAAIERSARWRIPIATKFRIRLSGRRCRWVALRAQPEDSATGVLWHGLMIDITEQMAEEARLRRLSDTDDLTGLANRRRLMTRLDEEIARSNRHGSPLSLMLLDLDHFKRINDTWGHLQGDQVLAEFATLCHQLLREEDIIGRLGGEEFAVLLPLTPLVASHPLAERLRHAIAAHDFGIEAGQVTASIGLAEYRLGESRDTLIGRADRSLYAAKHQGRNRVISG